MNVLVTGGAGFIGSHLCDALLKKGYSLYVIDDFSTGLKENINLLSRHDNFVLIEGTVLDKNIFAEIPVSIDLVFHLAAAVGVNYILDNTLRSIHTNIIGTENVLQFAVKNKSKVVFTSTSEVYGKSPNESICEEDDRVMGCTTVRRWSYACTKAVDEFSALAYHDEYGVPVVIARLFNTCGPRQRGQYGMVIPRFVFQALSGENITVYGDGEQIRSFTFVEDTVRALVCLSESEKAVGEVFNVGGNEPVSIKKLACLVKEKTNSLSTISFIPYKQAYGDGFEDMKKRIPNVSKIKNFINFKPNVGLAEILDKTIEFTKRKMELSNEKVTVS